MKKQIILLVVCVIVAGALGVTLWLLMGYEPADSGETSSVASTSTQIIEKTDYDLDTIAVKNENGEFVVKNLGDGDYTLEGMEDAPLATAMLKSVANAGTSLRADSTVMENAENLADFGLDAPRATFTAKYTDGSSFAFELGNEAPAGSGVYGRLPGESTVYLLPKSATNNLFNARLQFVSKTVVESPDDAMAQQNGTQTMPESVTLGGSFRPEEIVIQRTPDSTEQEKSFNLNLFQMIEPKKRGIDADEAVNALTGLLSISAEDVVAYKPTQEQLVEYGLDEPYSIVRFSYKDKEENVQNVSLKASVKDDEGKVYLVRDGVPLVYRLSATGIAWYEMEYQDFLSTLQLLPFIDSVKTMTIDFGGGDKTVFTLEGEGDELKVTADGKEIDAELFRKLYQNVIGIPSEEFTTDEAPGEETALLTVTYEYRDGAPADKMTLLPSSNPRKVFLSINGESEFYTKAAYVETIRTNRQQVFDGKEVGELY